MCMPNVILSTSFSYVYFSIFYVDICTDYILHRLYITIIYRLTVLQYK